MKFFLTPFGSSGDLFPFLWMAEKLRAMDHRPVVIGPKYHEERVARSGLPFVPVGDGTEMQKLLDHPDLWHPIKGPNLVFKTAAEGFELYYQALLAQQPEQPAILVSPSFQPAARLVRERTGCQLWTAHVQPAALLSLYDTPEMGGAMGCLRKMPRWMKRALLSLPNPFDRAFAKTGRQLCEKEGVQPPGNWLKEWWNSPDANLMLFPEWFGAPQPDWPAASYQVGFPLHDQIDSAALDEELENFLQAGSPPIVVTFGTAMKQASQAYRTVVEAGLALGRRVVVATEFRGDLPSEPGLLVVRYAPFSLLFRRSAVVVHHGGVGTFSQAAAAGVPQCMVPFSHDQFDNARRGRQAGIATSVTAKALTQPRMEAALSPLLETGPVSQAAKSVAAQMQQDRAGETFERLVEELLAN